MLAKVSTSTRKNVAIWYTCKGLQQGLLFLLSSISSLRQEALRDASYKYTR